MTRSSTSLSLRSAITLPLMAIALLAVGRPAGAAPAVIAADGLHFVDAAGREVIFHGLNAVRKNATWGSYDWLDEAGYAAMRGWGVNCVRLGFTWAELEPQPGEYSEECLQRLERHVEWARRHGIHVLLDFHQDLYAAKFSDGAPDWATLTDGLPHVAGGEAWSEAYVTSPAVQRAMDNFFQNKAAADGVGLQDHFAAAWAKVAARFAQAENVIGYDLMNEPFAGSLVPQGMGLMMAAAAAELNAAGRQPPLDVAGVAALWAEAGGRKELLAALADGAVYGRVADAAYPLYAPFDRQVLQPFYERVAAAIRAVDAHHLLFFENNGAGNMGVRSALEPLRVNGARDPRQAYAPHGYDLVTDTAAVASASTGRIGLIFDRHHETARRLGMPMIVGEWGAFYGNPAVQPVAEAICRKFEQLGCSDLLWAAVPDLDRQAVFRAFCRPYPMAIAGRLLGYASEPVRGEFECRWQESAGSGGSTVIFLPQAYGRDPSRLELVPHGSGFEIRAVGASGNVELHVPALGRGGERLLRVRAGTR